MKRFLPCLLTLLLGQICAAQNPQRNISIRTIGKDSVVLPLNDSYALIEDSCAIILRYCKFNFNTKKFFGKFKDVSKIDNKVTVAEGSYTGDGQKEGIFTTHYLNGNLQSRGSFKDDKYDGKWEFYYPDGKPELTFTATDDDFTITDAWDSDGSKSVDQGNGIYIVDFSPWYWVGKLADGKPDGKWKMLEKKDPTKTLVTEYFRKGKYINTERGENTSTDGPKIIWVSPFKLTLTKAERLGLSSVACGAIPAEPVTEHRFKQDTHLVDAHFEDNSKSFLGFITDALSKQMRRVNLSSLYDPVLIEGEINEKGNIVNLKPSDPKYQNIGRQLMLALDNLPNLIPAKLDGRPVKQKIVFSFQYHDGVVNYGYQLFPVQ